jgi:radical SAM protein with 4Fe4S-binding SPASM domain
MKHSNQDILNRIRKARLKPPDTLTMMITGGCNLSCSHCLLDCQPDTEARPVSTETLLKRIGAFADLGGKQIHIAGGEPLCHPEWYPILAYCCKQTGFLEVCLQTNATLLSRSRADKLNTLPAEKIIVQVSLDGSSAATHDCVRGSGAFQLAMDGIRRLVDVGLGERTRIAFTEMVHNFDDLPALLEMVDRLGIAGVISGTLLKGGRAARNDRVAPPDPSQYRDLILRYERDDRFRELYHQYGNIAAVEWHRGMSTPHTKVCTCIETPFIDADGWIYPCVMLPAEKYAVKLEDDKSLAATIVESLPLWAELPQMEMRRQAELIPCRDCPGKQHCLGGCMGRAYSAAGDFMAVEDRCALRKAVYCRPPLS